MSETNIEIRAIYLKMSVVSLWVLFFAMILVEASHTNFEIKRFELCNKTQGLINYKGNVTSEGHNQYLTFDAVTSVALDENIGVICRIECMTFGNRFSELFVIREKNFCKAVHSFMGEFWYDIERAAQHPPGHCPIPPRRYYVHHVPLEFKKISLQTFPFGILRFTIRLIDNKNSNTNVGCWLIEVNNLPN